MQLQALNLQVQYFFFLRYCEVFIFPWYCPVSFFPILRGGSPNAQFKYIYNCLQPWSIRCWMNTSPTPSSPLPPRVYGTALVTKGAGISHCACVRLYVTQHPCPLYFRVRVMFGFFKLIKLLFAPPLPPLYFIFDRKVSGHSFVFAQIKQCNPLGRIQNTTDAPSNRHPTNQPTSRRGFLRNPRLSARRILSEQQ